MATDRTITLTSRRPIRISSEAWPTIAMAKDHDNQYEFQANRKWMLRVRAHDDGRKIVYGTFDSQFANEPDVRAGYLVQTEGEMLAALRDVAEEIDAPDGLLNRCIADLPAEEIES